VLLARGRGGGLPAPGVVLLTGEEVKGACNSSEEGKGGNSAVRGRGKRRAAATGRLPVPRAGKNGARRKRWRMARRWEKGGGAVRMEEEAVTERITMAGEGARRARSRCVRPK